MAEWSLLNFGTINNTGYPYLTPDPGYQETTMQPPPPPPPPPPGFPRRQMPPPAQLQPSTSQTTDTGLHLPLFGESSAVPKVDTPRELRNKAEKRRRDRLNQSVAELAAMVPPVVNARRKPDKTTVLRLTAHYLRAYQHVFGDSIGRSIMEFSASAMMEILNLFKGFLITVTYKGLIVVVSENIHEYLGYSEIDLLGKNLVSIIHEDDRAMLLEQLMPKTQVLGTNGELLIPDEPGAKSKVEEGLAGEKRSFNIRFKKFGQRSGANQYVTCHVQGSLRKSDRASSSPNQCCQVVRRVRARTENPYSSGNDVVFIGLVRPSNETFMNESAIERYCMQYSTRHSIDGQIVQSEARIALVTGYMTHEVSGMNGMNFMHRDDVHYVIFALRDMYDEQKVYGESYYRLVTKNGECIYMRTRGRLEIEDSGACKSFVCSNIVIDEKGGKHFIKLMKRRYSVVVGDPDDDDEVADADAPIPVEDPRRLREVILHLINNLPAPPAAGVYASEASSSKSSSPPRRFTIIPPNKEDIVKAIGKIYDVIKSLNPNQKVCFEETKKDLITKNQPASGPIVEKYVEGASQDGIIIDQDVNDSNIFHFDEPSSSTSSIDLGLNDSNIFHFDEPSSSTAIIDLGHNDSNMFHYDEPTSSPLVSAPTYTGTENLINTEQDSTYLLNMDYLEQLPSGSSSISGINFNTNSDNTFDIEQENGTNLHDTDSQINFFPMARLPEELTFIQMPGQSAINDQGGIKRSYEYENEDIAYKKNFTEADLRPEISAFESTNLENFFDETFLDTQIETAINSLDMIDPTFPDFLVSPGVEDFLGQLEREQHGDELPEID